MSQTTAPTQVTVEQPAATQPPVTNEPQKDATTGKFIHEFESVDLDGNPKKYRFLYTDNNDLISQIQDSKVNGDRYLHEVKAGKRQLVHASPEPDFKAKAAATEEDKKRREQIRKDLEDELGAPLESLRETQRKNREMREYISAREWAMQKDGYEATPENMRDMMAFLNGDNPDKKPLDKSNWKNLDLAFEALQEKRKSSKEQTNSSSAPVVPEKVTPTASKPASGVRPGQFEGSRPSVPTNEQPLTAKRYREIARMSYGDFKRLERDSPKEHAAFIEMKVKASQPTA